MSIRPPWEENSSEEVNSSKRKPWLAGVLSFLQLGVGHVYVGTPLRGVSFLALLYVTVFTAGGLNLLSTRTGMLGTIGLSLFIIILAIFDAVMLARKKVNYHLKIYNHWATYLVLTVSLWMVWSAITEYKEKLTGHGAYLATSSAMTPTLQPGDYFITDSIPFLISPPKIGDVVVYKSPEGAGKKVIGRIMALEEDVVEIKEGRLLVNQHQASINVSLLTKATTLYSTSMDAVHVPHNSVFILGDNRDISRDSRVFGAIPVSDIVGRIEFIWLSKDIDRIGLEVK